MLIFLFGNIVFFNINLFFLILDVIVVKNRVDKEIISSMIIWELSFFCVDLVECL